MRKLFAMLFCLLAAEGAFAQAVHPNWERGIAAEKAYEFGDIDTVNLFNGNLNVAVPIGQTYHLGGALSYALVLHYGGNSWEFGSVDRSLELGAEWKHFSFSYPAKRQNAGFGWRLSLGELSSDLPCAVTGMPSLNAGWAYVGPDGGTHCFRNVPHVATEIPTFGVFYTG
ncbi:MAG: hypothetical protein JOZ54_14170, partial [Acidobacteria bacterium]|nr:hypothetical protein [Acidobacteriota bacterium]